MSRKEGQSLVLRIVTDPLRMNFPRGILCLQSFEEMFLAVLQGGRQETA